MLGMLAAGCWLAEAQGCYCWAQPSETKVLMPLQDRPE